MTIILYDIPSTHPQKAWSGNTLKARLVLNFKGLDYRTEWIEYPDIEAFSQKNGLGPTGKRHDGTDEYTLPAIHDLATEKWVADSFLIAKYLDDMYPETPSVFPNSTIGLQSIVEGALHSNITSFWPFLLAAVPKGLNEPSAIYWHRTRSAMVGGTPLDKLLPQGDDAASAWAKFEEGLGVVDSWYKKTDDLGPFLLGNRASWGDFVLAAFAICTKTVWGPESEEWKNISSWHNGRLGMLVDVTQAWQKVQ